MLTLLTIYMRARGVLNLVPPGVWVAVGVLMVGYGLWAAGDSYGYQRAEQEVLEQNQKAGETADEAALDRIACVDAGRVWDFAAGKCEGSISDNW